MKQLITNKKKKNKKKKEKERKNMKKIYKYDEIEF